MSVTIRVLVLALSCLAASGVARAATDVTLFRLFLTDGTSVVSYGEFAHLSDRVIFSMPVGGDADQPRLHVVTLPVGAIKLGSHQPVYGVGQIPALRRDPGRG